MALFSAQERYVTPQRFIFESNKIYFWSLFCAKSLERLTLGDVTELSQ